MTEREALKLALEALENWFRFDFENFGEVDYKAVAAIKEALAQPEQEPVAWVSSEELLVMRGNALGGAKDWRINVGLVKQDGDVGLYTTPPQRKPLTENEIKHLWYEACQTNLELTSQLIVHLARNIEAAHGIKGEV